MWPHFVNLLSQSWQSVLAALSTSTLAIILFSLAAPVVTFFVTLGVVSKLNAEKTFVEHLKQSVIPTLIGFAVPLVLLACVFSWKVVETVYNDHRGLVAQIGSQQLIVKTLQPQIDSLKDKLGDTESKLGNAEKRKPPIKDQCWMQNVTLPAPKTVPAAESSSLTAAYCNTERRAPLVVIVDYDKPVWAADLIKFPSNRQVMATEYNAGKQVFVKLDSPSILPYQIFTVIVYGSDQTPPIATKIQIKPLNTER